MNIRILGLDPTPFRPLFGLPDAELARQRAQRFTVDTQPGFPDRIELRDVEPGRTVLLVHHLHHDVDTPYRSSHAVYVREGATERHESLGELPQSLRIRHLSLRAFDARGQMLDADLAEGRDAEPLIERLLSLPGAAYLHAHYAKRGCYAARIERA